MTEPYPDRYPQDDDRPLDDLPDDAFDPEAPAPQDDYEPPAGEEVTDA
jgi:hypothetical protein